jgi:hypothetical protein
MPSRLTPQRHNSSRKLKRSAKSCPLIPASSPSGIRLVPAEALPLIEDRSIVVSESGIRTPQDLARLRAHGIHIALVGEHLMKQPDPGAALRELLG